MSSRASYRRMAMAIPTALCCVGLISSVHAEPPATQPSVEQKVSEDSVPSPLHADELIQNDRDAYLREKGLSLGKNPAMDTFITWGQGIVSVNFRDKAFSAARQNGYEAALIKAQAEYVKYKYLVILTDLNVEMAVNDSAPSLQEAPPEAEAKDLEDKVLDKLADLAQSELEARLGKVGVDSLQLAGKPKAEKIPILRRAIEKHAIETSHGSLAGSRILQTFEGHDAAGHYQMGVLLVTSPKLEAVAEVIRNGRAQRIGTQDHIDEIRGKIPHDATALTKAFGVRVFYDTDGNPWLVSFGQSALLNQGSSEVARSMLVENAYKKARSDADSQIADFANANVTWASDISSSELYENYTLKYPDKEILMDPASFISQSQESIKRSSKLTISGVSDVWTWHAKHPVSQQDIYGVVRIWSPITQQQAKELDHPASIPQAPVQALPTQPGTLRGPDMD